MDFVEPIVINILKGAIEYAKMKLIRTGIGDVSLKNWEMKREAETPEIFSCEAFLKLMKIVGLANFQAERLKLQYPNPGVDFDIFIPEVFFSLGEGGVNLIYLHNNADGQISGKIIVTEPRITGKANFAFNRNSDNFSPFSDLDLMFKLTSIKAELKVIINGKDYSETINTFVNVTVPDLIAKYQPSVNYFFEQVVFAIIKFSRSSEAASSGVRVTNISAFTLAMLKTTRIFPPEVIDLFTALANLKLDDGSKK